MVKRKKRLKKQEKGLLKQAEKHKIKAETEDGEKDTTKEYWLSEAERFELYAKQKKLIFEKLKEEKKLKKK